MVRDGDQPITRAHASAFAQMGSGKPGAAQELAHVEGLIVTLHFGAADARLDDRCQ